MIARVEAFFRRSLALGRTELLHVFRDRATVLQILLAPIIQLLVLSNVATFAFRNSAVYVVDFDHSSVSRGLVSRLGSSGFFELQGWSASPDAADEAMLRGKAAVVITIPHDFETSLRRTGVATVHLDVNAEKGSAAGVVQSYIVQILNAYSAELRSDIRPSLVSVRAALGVTRTRLARQLVTESLLLSFVGGLAGLLPAWAALRVVSTLGPAQVPRLASAGLDGRAIVMGFALVGACALMIFDLFVKSERRTGTFWFAQAVLLLCALATVFVQLGTGRGLYLFNGLFVVDAMANLIKLVSYAATSAALVYSRQYLLDRGLLKGEFVTLMALMMSLGNVRYKGYWVAGGILAYCASLLLLAVSPWFALSMVAVGLLGFFDSVQMVPRNGLIQAITPDELRGRVSSFQSMLTGGVPSLGQTTSGALAQALGAPLGLLVGAVACIATIVNPRASHSPR